MAIAAETGKRPCSGQSFEISTIQPGTLGQVLHAGERLLAARVDNTFGALFGERLYQAHAKAQCWISIVHSPFERALMAARLDTHWPHLYTVLPSISHELRRSIKSHRQAIEQCACEGCRLVTLQPGRVIHEKREACCVALGKTVLAEPQHLTKDAFRELLGVAAFQHSDDQLVLEGLQ